MHQTLHRTPAALTGARIRALRSRTGMTAEDLAVQAGLHLSHFRRVEGGNTNPTLETLARVAYALGTNVADLVRDVSTP